MGVTKLAPPRHGKVDEALPEVGRALEDVQEPGAILGRGHRERVVFNVALLLQRAGHARVQVDPADVARHAEVEALPRAVRDVPVGHKRDEQRAVQVDDVVDGRERPCLRAHVSTARARRLYTRRPGAP
jgi:hypothetical protein